jgi:nitroreductase
MSDFQTIQHIIRNRRTVKPADMNGKIIEKEKISQLLEMADWAPTHGRTEPWRFVVYEKAARQSFCKDHAELYKNNTEPEKFNQGKYDKLVQIGDTVSHIILVYMKRTQGHAVPAIEELAAVSAAIQNILLGTAASGISVLWSTGGMTHHPAMKTYLNLTTEDQVMGILYLGYSDLPLPEGKRNFPLETKIDWRG